MHSLITMICFYNDSRGHLTGLLILELFQVFFIVHVVNLVPLTVGALLVDIVVVLIFIICGLCICLTIFYVMQLHAVLEFTNGENVKLLDGMHEGLCILKKTARFADEEESQVLFCNRPARKLLFDEKKMTEAAEENSVFTKMQFAPLQ